MVKYNSLTVEITFPCSTDDWDKLLQIKSVFDNIKLKQITQGVKTPPSNTEVDEGRVKSKISKKEKTKLDLLAKETFENNSTPIIDNVVSLTKKSEIISTKKSEIILMVENNPGITKNELIEKLKEKFPDNFDKNSWTNNLYIYSYAKSKYHSLIIREGRIYPKNYKFND